MPDEPIETDDHEVPEYGARCPVCEDRCSELHARGGCLLVGLGIISLGLLPLLLLPFRPRVWHCNRCHHEWRA